MSCKPPSWFLTRLDKYEYSLGRALSSRGAGLDDDVMEYDTKDTSKVAERSGTGSSGLDDWLRKARKGW